MTETCKTCRHWHAGNRPVLPAQDGQPGGAVDMSAKLIGECRARPPQVIMVELRQVGVGLEFRHNTAYPRMLEDFPACGLHNEKVQGWDY
ncbi:MAG: hypothetical protein KGL39_47090 [Patescibacteria group bacterium]|nr:hypothetical protein [Patescibacteria group bacterium]